MYYRFSLGTKYRMVPIWKPNKGFSTKILLRMLQEAKEKRKDAIKLRDKHVWTVFVVYAVMIYELSLRGVKGLMLDLERYRQKTKVHREVFWMIFWEYKKARMLTECIMFLVAMLQVLELRLNWWWKGWYKRRRSLD